jgi:hypothetical protein
MFQTPALVIIERARSFPNFDFYVAVCSLLMIALCMCIDTWIGGFAGLLLTSVLLFVYWDKVRNLVHNLRGYIAINDHTAREMPHRV